METNHIFLVFDLTKKKKTQQKQILFQFVSVRTNISFLFVSRTPEHKIYATHVYRG
jgi:hypothetical protein